MLTQFKSATGTSLIEALVGFCLLGMLACLTAQTLSWTTRTLGHGYQDYSELKELYDLAPKEISSSCSFAGDPQYLKCAYGDAANNSLKIITQ